MLEHGDPNTEDFDPQELFTPISESSLVAVTSHYENTYFGAIRFYKDAISRKNIGGRKLERCQKAYAALKGMHPDLYLTPANLLMMSVDQLQKNFTRPHTGYRSQVVTKRELTEELATTLFLALREWANLLAKGTQKQ